MKQSVPYTPLHNGAAKRKNRSLKEMATCLLEARSIPPYLWDDADICASYIQNRVPHKLVIWANPFKALMGHKLNVSHRRVFGSKIWAIIPTDKRKALQDQNSECILLGYADDANTYKLMDLATKKCFIEHNMQFEEDQVHDPPQSEA